MKIDIYGNGAEIVIGKLSEKQTQKIFPLLAKKEDGIDETEFETIMEKPWNEIDNIFHFGHSIFKNVEKKFQATRYHSLIIEKKSSR